MRETFFHDLAKNVEQKFVRFLNARGRFAFHDKIDIGHADGRSAVAPEERDRFQFARFRFFQRAFHIFFDLPEVVRQMSRSFSTPKAATWRAKISSNP